VLYDFAHRGSLQAPDHKQLLVGAIPVHAFELDALACGRYYYVLSARVEIARRGIEK
jgi:hypothetical protein